MARALSVFIWKEFFSSNLLVVRKSNSSMQFLLLHFVISFAPRLPCQFSWYHCNSYKVVYHLFHFLRWSYQWWGDLLSFSKRRFHRYHHRHYPYQFFYCTLCHLPATSAFFKMPRFIMTAKPEFTNIVRSQKVLLFITKLFGFIIIMWYFSFPFNVWMNYHDVNIRPLQISFAVK